MKSLHALARVQTLKDRAGLDDADVEALDVAVKLLGVYAAALSWITTHDGASVANARRLQRVAAGALHKGEAPDVVLGKRGTA